MAQYSASCPIDGAVCLEADYAALHNHLDSETEKLQLSGVNDADNETVRNRVKNTEVPQDMRLDRSQQIGVIMEWLQYYDNCIRQALDHVRNNLANYQTPESAVPRINSQASRSAKVHLYVAAWIEWQEKLDQALNSPDGDSEKDSELTYLPRVEAPSGRMRMEGQFSLGGPPLRPENDTMREWHMLNWMHPYYTGHERVAHYKPGGFHPAAIGEVIKERYCVVHKLGRGGYATIWLVWDKLDGRHVALKISRADVSMEQSECKMLHDISKAKATFAHPFPDESSKSVVRALHTFELSGPNGTHPCYTMPVARCDLRSAFGGPGQTYRFKHEVGRKISVKIILAVAHLHSKGFVHGDLTIGNILLRFPPGTEAEALQALLHDYGEPFTEAVERRDGAPLPPTMLKHAIWPVDLGKHASEFTTDECHILLGDFGESWSPATEQRLGKDCHTPGTARALEARFDPEAPLTSSMDIWAMAIIMWRIILDFEPFDDFGFLDQSDFTRMLGPLPDRWAGKPATGLGSWGDDDMSEEDNDGLSILDSCEAGPPPSVLGLDGEEAMMSAQEYRAFIRLMREMWRFEPQERATIQDVLESEWFLQWGLPALGQEAEIGWKHKI